MNVCYNECWFENGFMRWFLERVGEVLMEGMGVMVD